MREGRPAFLEFLRNLTPQILLLSLALLVGRKLDFSTFDWSNSTPTLIFFTFLIISLMAAWANATLFIEKFVPLKRVGRKFRLVSKKCTFKNRARINIVWKKKWVFLEGILIFMLVEFCLAGVFVSAIATAQKMIM